MKAVKGTILLYKSYLRILLVARSEWILRDIENISLGRTDALFVTRIFYALKIV
jgi:hypothetical protein